MTRYSRENTVYSTTGVRRVRAAPDSCISVASVTGARKTAVRVHRERRLGLRLVKVTF